ncbi:adenosine deaminase [Spirochaeta isovalerica]|uniref:adenosine deaminase n=1 Tax=Spirochaeta isovalerica TaxID=150 RepID=A0A841RIH5_9SPIO|nr:adenosine deaminase [Spirochaeta isovalerica]
MRFAPEHFAEYNDFDRIEVVKTVINAADRAAKEINLPINYLLTYNRMFQTAEQMIEQHKKIDKLEIPSIVGIDLAGDEVNYAPELYIPFFDYIKGLNKYKIDIHAGEITGPDQVWSAIEKLHADRIGHGISAIKDTKLLEYLKKNDIYLCQCITSNFQTGSWVDSPSHPLNDLYKMGYPVCINSDDPSVQDADLTDDYLKCVEYFDFSAEDFYKLNINAINASFISENEKRILISKFDKEYKVFLEKLK